MPKRTIIFLIVMVTLAPFAMDIYLPGLENMVRDFHSSYGTVQLTISLYMLGFALSQLIFGPLSDHYGRRPIFFIGISIFLVGSLSCFFAPTIWFLIIARFLQALGGCVGLVTGFAVVRDSCNTEECVKLLATLSVAMATAFMIAPVMGAYFITTWGWRSSSLFVFVVGLILLISCYFFLEETSSNRSNSFSFRKPFVDYKELSQHPVFLRYGFYMILSFAGFFTFIANSPDLLIHDLKLSITAYSYLFALNGLMLVAGNWVTTRMITRVGIDGVIKAGAIIITLAAAALFVLDFIFGYQVWTVMVPMFFATFGYALLLPPSLAALLGPFKDKSATATALANFSRYLIAPVVATIAGYLSFLDQWPLAFILLFGSVAILVIGHTCVPSQSKLEDSQSAHPDRCRDLN